MAAVHGDLDTPSPSPMGDLNHIVSPSPTPNTSLSNTGVGDMATRATFLSLFIIIGFVGNSVLIATIAQSSRLKGSTINLCIISLAVANLLDSAGNMPLILGATITEKWDYGSFACHLNAFGLQLVSIAVSLGLMVLTMDRCVAVIDPVKHRKRLGLKRISIIISFFWVYSIAFSIPLMLDSVVPIKVFPVRYLCTISNDTPLAYLCMTSICCFLIPVCLCICFFIYIIKSGAQLKRKEIQECSQPGYLEGSRPPNRKWPEIEGAKFAGVMFIIWLILQAPYLILSSIMWYRNSTELAGNKEVNDLLYFEYPWELELALTWLKLSYPIFLPSVTFLWKKEVWQKFKNAVLCRKSNLVVDASPHSSPERRGNGTTTITNGVPVLFATENGLHIQTYNDEESDREDSDSESRDTSHTQTMVTKKCDVYGSQFLQLDEEDTSDYDSSSEIDPFSNSNPISVRTEYGQQRSVSSNGSRLSNSRGKIPASPQHKYSSSPSHLVPESTTREGDEQETRLSTICESSPDKRNRRRSQNQPPDGSAAEFDVENKGVDNPALVLEDEDTSQVIERTSHDSGMGSWDKSKKIKKHRRKKMGSDESGEGKGGDVKDDEEKSQNGYGFDVASNDMPPGEVRTIEPDIIPVVRKKRKKKSPAEVIVDSHGAKDINEKVDCDAIVTPEALPTKLQPLQSKSRNSSGENIEHLNQSSTKPVVKSVKKDSNMHRPVVPPRMINSHKLLLDKTEPEVGDTNQHKRVPSTGEKPVPQKRVSQILKTKPKTTTDNSNQMDIDNCECAKEQANDTTSTEHWNIDVETGEDKLAVNDVGGAMASEPKLDRPKVKKKCKKRALDPATQQRKLAEELDQEIQGVLY